MRGIVLAGGLGSRLDPLTRVVNKHFLPVYDRPMIHYPLLTLKAMGVHEVTIIVRPEDLGAYYRLLTDSDAVDGLGVTFMKQENPRGGIAEGLLIGADFTGYRQADSVALILGDNLFWGDASRLVGFWREPFTRGARIFTARVPPDDTASFGVLRVDADDMPVSIEEKPIGERTGRVVTGLYLFDGRAHEVASQVQRSARGELEIADVIRWYLERGELEHRAVPRDVYWADLGTPARLSAASEYVHRTQYFREEVAI